MTRNETSSMVTITSVGVLSTIIGFAIGYAASKSFGAVPLAMKAVVGAQKRRTPNPAWKPGDKNLLPEKLRAGKMISFDPKSLVTNYPLVVSSFVPRPVAFVSTRSKAGVNNLATFSYASVVGHSPPTVCFSVCTRPIKGGVVQLKDTLVNVLETKEFTLNMISDWFVEAANYTCGEWPPEVDEMQVSGLTPVASTMVAPDCVAESAVTMECKLVHTHEIFDPAGNLHSTIVIGEVVMWHVNSEVVEGADSGKPSVRFEDFRPVSRLGGNDFGLINTYFTLPRPRGAPGEPMDLSNL